MADVVLLQANNALYARRTRFLCSGCLFSNGSLQKFEVTASKYRSSFLCFSNWAVVTVMSEEALGGHHEMNNTKKRRAPL